MYPSVQPKDLAERLFPDSEQPVSVDSSEEVVVRIPNSIVHLIDKQQSIELASGIFEIIRLRQSGNVVAVLARIADQIQWPLAKDEAAVKLDGSHYFFTLRVPEDVINYGLTIPGNEGEQLDRVLDEYSAFSVKEVEGGVAAVEGGASAEATAAAYWTALAPNVEDYSSSVARMIAAGSGQLIKGILWCGDVTVDSLKWGNEVLKKRLKSGHKAEVSPQALRRMERPCQVVGSDPEPTRFFVSLRQRVLLLWWHNDCQVAAGSMVSGECSSQTLKPTWTQVKKLTKMSECVATGLLSGVVKVSGFFTSAIVNSIPGKKFFNLLPGEIILASLDGFNKVCDAVEVAGRNVMSSTSTVTTDLVTHKQGEDAAKVTSTGMDAAGHAFGTAWAVFKIRKALNPKSVVKPSSLVKAASSSK